MSILLIDFETTSVNTKEARVIEIGARLVTDDLQQTIGIPMSHLVYAPDYPAITPEVERVTGISEAMLKADGLEPMTAFKLLGNLVTPDLKYAIAYNSGYDQDVYKEEMYRHCLTLDANTNWLLTIPWLCGMGDIEKNYEFKSWRMAHVALEHGCTVCLKDLHRAINDVDLMWDMLKRSGTTPQDMYAFQQSPWVYAVAKVEKPWLDNGRSSDIAKANGFSFERARGDNSGRTFTKQWVIRLKQKNYDKLLTLPIQVEKVQI